MRIHEDLGCESKGRHDCFPDYGVGGLENFQLCSK